MLIGIVLGLIAWNLAYAMKVFGKHAGLRIWTRVSAGVQRIKTPGLGAFLMAVSLYSIYAIHI